MSDQVSVKTSCTGTEGLPLEAAMTESTESEPDVDSLVSFAN